MFKIKFSPIEGSKRIKIECKGDKLIINNEELDFSPLKEGEILPREAINNDYVLSDVKKVDGLIELTLLLTLDGTATQDEKFPKERIFEDGIITDLEVNKW